MFVFKPKSEYNFVININIVSVYFNKTVILLLSVGQLCVIRFILNQTNLKLA